MNNKPQIGLYLAAKPEAGGIYQYALSLIDALLEIKSFEVIFFVEDENWKKHLPNSSSMVTCEPKKIKKGLGRLLRKISPSLRDKLAVYIDDSVNKINKSNCDLVIFPSQDSLTYQINKKSLTTVHDLMHRYESHFDEYQNGVFQEREIHYSKICMRAEGILVDSELGKKHVQESYSINEEKIHILKFVPPYYLKKSQTIDLRKKYDLNESFIFYPAQFWEHKNHENLVKASKILKDKGISIQTVFIGSAKNNYTKIISLIKDLKLENEILVLGYVPIDEVFSFYKQAKAMVFVSLAGPTNIPPIESMMLECPAIVSNAYAMPNQVEEGALLIDAKNPADIAQKIEMILDPLVAQKLIKKGRKQIDKWNQTDFNKEVKKIIFKILKLNNE